MDYVCIQFFCWLLLPAWLSWLGRFLHGQKENVFFYFAFDGLSTYFPSAENFISSLGMDDHFKSMSRGVIDTRDMLYFISLTIVFLSLTVFKLKSSKA